MDRSYAKDQLFVAVSDSDATYAGYDGGPQRGGKGRWKKGDVGPWQADYRVPLAKRNPDDGLIWKGWLEKVVETARRPDGSLECLKSEPIFERMPTPEQRTQKHFAEATAESERQANAQEPSASATDRAANGGTSIKDVLTPNKAKGKRPAKHSVEAAIGAGDGSRITG